MKALLDTHAFLWWNTNDAKLSLKAREIIGNPDNIIVLSVVSAWEIVIKHSLGKLPLPETPEEYIPSRLQHYGFQTLSVKLTHVLGVSRLAEYHNDPFDRLLIAQSQTEELPIITVDEKIQQYPVSILW